MSGLGVDEGLLRRLRDAGARLTWRAGGAPRRAGRTVRIARLSDEEARVETVQAPEGELLEATAGPVGALVLLLEADRRGPPTALVSRNAGRSPAFPDGSIVAAWGPTAVDGDARPSLRDLVELARYALA
jgi:hypothetical protein